MSKTTGTCDICGRTDVTVKGGRLGIHRKSRSGKHSAYCSGFGRSAK